MRPIAYAEDGVGHPDRRPCPSWCWVAQHGGEYTHEVDSRHPMGILHTRSDTPSVGLSLYPACPAHGERDRVVRLATLEPHLQQLGDGEPEIHVGRCTFESRERVYQDDSLRLPLDDAQDLMAVLAHLVETAERPD